MALYGTVAFFLYRQCQSGKKIKNLSKFPQHPNVNINVWCQIKRNKSGTAHFTLFFPFAFFHQFPKLKSFYTGGRYIKRFCAFNVYHQITFERINQFSLLFFLPSFFLLFAGSHRILLTPLKRLRNKKI